MNTKIYFIFTILFSSPVLAYLDPGSISLFMQAVIGAFVASTLFLKKYYYKIKSYFLKNKKTSK